MIGSRFLALLLSATLPLAAVACEDKGEEGPSKKPVGAAGAAGATGAGPTVLKCGADISLAGEHDGCDAMDVLGTSGCKCLPLGFAWDGSACAAVNCSCAGADCERLYATIEKCDAAKVDCK